MSVDDLEPMEAFQSWLLRRVTQAVEAGDVSADLLAELQAEIEAAREKPQEEGHAEAVWDIAERLGIPVDQVERGLSALEEQPPETRELALRQIAEAWLEGQRKVYRGRSGSRRYDRPAP